MLDFSRVEAGRMQVAFEARQTSASGAPRMSVSCSAPRSNGAKVRLVVDCPELPAEAVFMSIRTCGRKIVLNLVSNAFKFTLAGRGAREAHRAGRVVGLEVRDTGCGIRPERSASRVRAIPSWARPRMARTAEGSGIGLSLIHELVKLHGGTIERAECREQGHER